MKRALLERYRLPLSSFDALDAILWLCVGCGLALLFLVVYLATTEVTPP